MSCQLWFSKWRWAPRLCMVRTALRTCSKQYTYSGPSSDGVSRGGIETKGTQGRGKRGGKVSRQRKARYRAGWGNDRRKPWREGCITCRRRYLRIRGANVNSFWRQGRLRGLPISKDRAGLLSRRLKVRARICLRSCLGVTRRAISFCQKKSGGRTRSPPRRAMLRACLRSPPSLIAVSRCQWRPRCCRFKNLWFTRRFLGTAIAEHRAATNPGRGGTLSFVSCPVSRPK